MPPARLTGVEVSIGAGREGLLGPRGSTPGPGRIAAPRRET